MASKSNKVLNIFLDICVVLAIIVTVYFIFFSVTHFSSNVQGTSMKPTFNNETEEDRILASKIAGYSYGDIVILSVKEEGSEQEKDIIKRIYAFGGDSVDMVYNNHYLKIIVNGKEVEENQYSQPIYYQSEPNTYLHFCALKSSWKGEGGGDEAIIIPKNAVFVLGDNREDSRDSATYGAYDLSCIKAKVLTKIPKNSFAPFELIKYYL